MAGSVNKVILLGNLGKDPEVRHFEGGRSVANFSLATTESYKDKNGERQDQTEWHNISIWRPGLVGIAEKYLKKGNKVYLEGRLRTRSWEDQNQVMKYTTEIVVENLTLLGAPNSNEAKPSTTSTSNTAKNETSIDDDLPF
ncbi:MAG: single-stranded DNA-binding protein [Salibacteraceae bacterium]